MAAGILLLVAEFLSVLQALDKYSSLSKNPEPELPEIPESWFPDVDVLITTHNESRELLYKTVNACTFMLYPDRSKIHIFICDDTNRPEMASLAEELRVGYFGISDNKLLKAGNMNNALDKTFSPLILTLDADMIPSRDILRKTVPYFFLPRLKKQEDGAWIERTPEEIDPDYKIGFIQTPQSFYNADLFQFNLYSEDRIPNEQDYFFREVNVNRNSANAPIYAGTNTVISREALKEAGNIATGTITEDFATGLNIQKNGWTTYATSVPLAHGLAPDTIGGLLNQRERWGRGCIQSLSKARILTVKLPWKTRWSYLNTYFYWWTFMARLIFIISPILFAVFRLRLVVCTWWQFILFWLPYYLLYGLTLRLTSGETRNQHWNSVIDTIIFPYMAGPILIEALGRRLKKFKVTNKSKSEDDKSSWLYALPHILLFITSAAALIMTVSQSLKTSAIYNIIIMFWLVVNSKNLLLSVFFMLGRKNIRQNSRFYVNLPVELHTERGKLKGKTLDISEQGMAIELNWPEFIMPESEFKLIINGKPYRAEMLVRVLHIEHRQDSRWKYSVKITDLNAKNKRKYFQIIYDRHHSMPDRIAEDWSMFDDYSLNLSKRTETIMSVHRKLPRIETNVSVRFKSGPDGRIFNFNYQYMSLRVPIFSGTLFDSGGETEYMDSGELRVESFPDLCFMLKHVTAQLAKGADLYYIENWAALLDAPGYRDLINFWIEGRQMKAQMSCEVYASQVRVSNIRAAQLLLDLAD